MGSGAGGGGQSNPYYSMGQTPSDNGGGLGGFLNSKVGGINGTSYGGLLAGGLGGLGSLGGARKQQGQQAAPAMNYNAGTTAQAFAPARAQILRNTSQYANMPSGYRDSLLNNLNTNQARTFDSTLSQAMMANELAKQQGAAGLQGQQEIAGNNALAYGGQAIGANNSLFGGPRKTGVGGTIGGAVQGVANSFASGTGQGVGMMA